MRFWVGWGSGMERHLAWPVSSERLVELDRKRLSRQLAERVRDSMHRLDRLREHSESDAERRAYETSLCEIEDVRRAIETLACR